MANEKEKPPFTPPPPPPERHDRSGRIEKIDKGSRLQEPEPWPEPPPAPPAKQREND
jgi:hypothetical protein